MKENKKAILDILKKKSKKDGKFENLVLNLALQKIGGFCIIPWIKMLNYPSISTKLS